MGVSSTVGYMRPYPDLPEAAVPHLCGRAPAPAGYAPLRPTSPPAGSPGAGRGHQAGLLQRGRGAESVTRRRRGALGEREAPPAPSAGRSPAKPSCQPSPEPAVEGAREGAAAGGGRGGGTARREAGPQGEGGREERRTQRAPGSWSFCSAWPGFNAQQQRAAAAAGQPGELRRRPSQRRPRSPAPATSEQPARGPGRARRPRPAPRPRSPGRRSASGRRRPAPPVDAPRPSRSPVCPSARPRPVPAGAGRGQPRRGSTGAPASGAAAAQGGAQRRGTAPRVAGSGACRAWAAARPGEHGRCGATPPCPLGIKDIQPAGWGRRGAAPRRHRSPREPRHRCCSGFGA